MAPKIVPPFTEESAIVKVQIAEDLWNARDPERVALAYTEDAEWRNRSEFIKGRAQIVAFLRRKWATELDYKLRKTLWGFRGNRMMVSFEQSSHDSSLAIVSSPGRPTMAYPLQNTGCSQNATKSGCTRNEEEPNARRSSTPQYMQLARTQERRRGRDTRGDSSSAIRPA